MRTITVTEKYRAVNEGKMAKSEFVRQMRQSYPMYVSSVSDFNSTVQILKNRNMLFEEKTEVDDSFKYSTDSLRRAIDIELEAAGLMSHEKVSGEDQEKARVKAVANLKKDPLHYYHLISGDSSKVDKHDKTVEVKKGNEVDTFNGLKKAELKENLKEGTRALVGYLSGDRLTTTYNHYDGYPTGLGQGLMTHYNNDDLAKDIAMKGYITSMDPASGEISATHSDPAKKITLDDDAEERAREIAGEIDGMGADYGYIWDDESNQWITIKNTGIRSMIDQMMDKLSMMNVYSGDKMNEDEEENWREEYPEAKNSWEYDDQGYGALEGYFDDLIHQYGPQLSLDDAKGLLGRRGEGGDDTKAFDQAVITQMQNTDDDDMDRKSTQNMIQAYEERYNEPFSTNLIKHLDTLVYEAKPTLKETLGGIVAFLKSKGAKNDSIKDFIKTHKDDIQGMSMDDVEDEYNNFLSVNTDYVDEAEVAEGDIPFYNSSKKHERFEDIADYPVQHAFKKAGVDMGKPVMVTDVQIQGYDEDVNNDEMDTTGAASYYEEERKKHIAQALKDYGKEWDDLSKTSPGVMPEYSFDEAGFDETPDGHDFKLVIQYSEGSYVIISQKSEVSEKKGKDHDVEILNYIADTYIQNAKDGDKAYAGFLDLNIRDAVQDVAGILQDPKHPLHRETRKEYQIVSRDKARGLFEKKVKEDFSPSPNSDIPDANAEDFDVATAFKKARVDMSKPVMVSHSYGSAAFGGSDAYEMSAEGAIKKLESERQENRKNYTDDGREVPSDIHGYEFENYSVLEEEMPEGHEYKLSYYLDGDYTYAITQEKSGVSEKKGKDHDGDGDIDGDDYMAAKDKAIKKAMGKDEAIRESLKAIITKVLEEKQINEAATNVLAAFGDDYAGFEGMKSAINQLENIVTDIEQYYDKTRTKIQKIYDTLGEIRNEEGLKVGGFLAPAVEQAFNRDLRPVIKMGFTKGLDQPQVKKLASPGMAQETEAPKETVFTPVQENKKK